MSERSILIIEKASELFAKNGFEATSVQQITDACGISKGSFYLSFKSKEALLFAIFKYFSEKLQQQLEDVFAMDLTGTDRLERSLRIYFEEIDKYASFILMQIREQMNPINDEMMQLANANRMRSYELQRRLILDVYGESAEPFLPDLVTLLGGMIKSYIEVIVFNKTPLDYRELARFLAEVFRSVVEGMEQPFLKTDQLVKIGGCHSDTVDPTLLADIQQMKQQFGETDDRYISLDVIEQELKSEKVRLPVIRGMLSTLEETGEIGELAARILQQFD